MKRANSGILAAIAVAVALPVAASAETSVNAVTDLNIRSGPGNTYAISGVIPAGGEAMLAGCAEGGTWCRVSHDGVDGWAYAPYLSVKVENDAYVLPERPASVEVKTVTYEDKEGTAANQTAGVTAGATIGALAAYAAGGPVGGIIASGILGATAGAAAAEPSTETITYIQSNPVETVYLDGEVAVGAGVPDTVTTYELPEEGYRYVSINDQVVIVDANNAIVRVLR